MNILRKIMHQVGFIYKIIINLLVSESVKVKVKFTLEQAMNAHRGSRGIALLFLLTSVLDGGWVVSATPRPLYPWERPGTHCIGGWLGPGPVWMGAENLAPHRDLIPQTVWPVASELDI